jgi:hypothetical protein
VSEDRFPRPDESTDAVAWAGVLTVTAPPTQAGRSVAIEPKGTTVGRDATCDLALASEHIGRHQAVVALHGNLYVVEDLGSTNPTLLNGVPVTGTRPLHSGDRLTFADVEVEFRMMVVSARSPRPVAPDEAVVSGDGAGRRTSLRQELREAPGFSGGALMLAVLGAVVSTTLTGASGAGPWGTLVGAAVGPVVTTTFTTKKAGEKGRVRTAAIVILSLTALVITVVGIGIADRAAGHSVMPFSSEQASTFPQAGDDGGGAPTVTTSPPESGSTSSTSLLPVPVPDPPSLDCGRTSPGTQITCPVLTIRNDGASTLEIRGVELRGDAPDDFIAHEDCVGRSLDQSETCTMNVEFRPQASGSSSAVLVIHQNLPDPDPGTFVSLSGVSE